MDIEYDYNAYELRLFPRFVNEDTSSSEKIQIVKYTL